MSATAFSLRTRVTGHQVSHEGHAVYIIVSELSGGRRCVAYRRYTEFAHLHAVIGKVVGLPIIFPVPKRVLHTSRVKEERVPALDSYLSWAVVAAGDNPPQALFDFLGVDLDGVGIGGAAWREVIAAKSNLVTPGELFIKRVVAAGSGGADSLGGRMDEPENAPAASPAAPYADVEFELSRDVYATAFVLASNATEGMYSFVPWHNRQMCLLWVYLSFIIASQAFVLICLVLLLPAVVDTRTFLIDCDARTPPAAAALAALEAAAAATSSSAAEQCDATSSPFEGDDATALPALSPAALAACVSLDIEIDIPLTDGRLASFRRLEVPIYFYQNVFRAAVESADRTRGALLACLQVVCCIWVTVQVYFVDCRSVEALLSFRDFNRWLLPLKVCDLTISHHHSPDLTTSPFHGLR